MNNLPTQYSHQIINQTEVIVSGATSEHTFNSRTEVFNTNTESSVKKFSSKIMRLMSDKNLQNIHTFDFDDLGAVKCSEHDEFKENFLMQVISGHNLYDAVCSECLSELQQINDNNIKSRLYSSVIKENREKIVQIRENKIDFESVTKAHSISATLQENIMLLADELISFTESFESEVLNKLSDKRTDTYEIDKIKVFIGEILNEKNEPVLKNIGKDEIRKIKYIKLAYFLLHFRGIVNNISYSGISVALKLHLTRIIELRNLIVIRLTEWIRFILGDFYEYVFLLEGLALDSNFLNGLVIDYGGNIDVSKIRIEYEQIITFKDERIRSLENEINQLKIQIESSQNVCQSQGADDDLVTNLHIQIKQIEEKWNSQNIHISQLNQEIETLKKLNNEYLIIIENMKQEIMKIKSEIESKFQVIFIKMKEEYEGKLFEVVENLESIKIRYTETEIEHNEHINLLTKEKEEILRILREKEEIIKTHIERINILTREREETLRIIQEKELIVQRITQNTEKIVYVDKPVPGPERIVEKIVDKIVYVDKPVEKIEYVEKVVENIVYVDKPVERIEYVEKVVENIVYVDKPVERIEYVEKVVEKIVYVDKPVEKIVYIEKPVENIVHTEKIVEKIVHVDKPVEKIIYVDKPTERIVNVDKIVEKIVYVDKPVEKIVYVENPSEVVECAETFKEVERLMTNVVEIDNSETIKKTYKLKYETYINDIKSKISVFQEEWDLLFSNYNTLLADFKILLDSNYRFKNILLELEGVIERHNLEVGNLDMNIRKEIESLTRTSLSNKNIEWNSQRDVFYRSSSELEALKAKISRIEMNKFSNSSVLEDVTMNVRCIFTETQNSIFEQNGIIIKSYSPSFPDLYSSINPGVEVGGNSSNQGSVNGTSNLIDVYGVTKNLSAEDNYTMSGTINNYTIGDDVKFQRSLTGYQSGVETKSNAVRFQNSLSNQNSGQFYGYQSEPEIRYNEKKIQKN